ncbi:hypothetical protein [Bosea vestrisii]|uniref:Uncharacterized protein n=1 Tax=Bosea vestrisii TaxID=151416 RepID=A0ABW0HC14_9HYPH
MIPILLSCDGRLLASHAAIVLASAVAASGPTTLIRVVERNEPLLPDPSTDVESVRIIEIRGEGLGIAAHLDEALTAARREGRRAVLDLPASFLADASLLGRPDAVPVVPVGASGREISVARQVLSSSAKPSALQARSTPLARLLPLGRVEAAAATEDNDRSAFPLLGASLPRPRARDIDLVATWKPLPGLIRAGEAVLAEMGAAITSAPPAAGSTFPDAAGPGLAETLRGLADALDEHAEGVFPHPDELESAPLLDDWCASVRASPAMVGRVSGHPILPPGRRALTSEVFLTDGRSYARTLSRLYRLGRPKRLDGTATDRSVG